MSLNRVALASIAACLLAAGPGLAADGVIEINETRAKAGGITPGDAPGYPVTLSQPGSYRLTGSLIVTTASLSAIEITSDDVSLDLNGFPLVGVAGCNGEGATLVCTPTGAGVGIFAHAREGISVRNGFVYAFPGGGAILSQVEGCTVEDVSFLFNAGRALQVGGSCTLSGLVIDRNAGEGVFVLTNDPSPADSPSDDAVLRESVLSRNRGEGVFTTSSAGRDRFQIERSAISGNGRTGADLRTEGGLRDSAVFGNAQGGIRLGVNSQDPDSGMLRGNAVRSNAYGFALDPAQVGYTHNNVTGNAGASSGGVQIGPNVCEGDLICP